MWPANGIGDHFFEVAVAAFGVLLFLACLPLALWVRRAERPGTEETPERPQVPEAQQQDLYRRGVSLAGPLPGERGTSKTAGFGVAKRVNGTASP